MHAAEVKSLESALAARSRLLAAFEAAEAESNAEARDTSMSPPRVSDAAAQEFDERTDDADGGTRTTRRPLQTAPP